ncbi:uncharacterized protein LOC111987261 [Quercus suber]|uniref:uncharacterized protein LOC111987261 n=1 Tax=Quercus suber TaxID=58331 RepID=UPI000CE1AA00|nr:uncharacterized protein LOC111987261 [Quercus suber]
MSIFAWNCRGLGSSLAVRNLVDAVKKKDLLLVFLSETKASVGRIKGIQNKLNFTQGIVVPSDGRSGGLALIWKEGTEVFLKSCSHSHIDVVVRDGLRQSPWKATGFYGHPDASKRYTSWELLIALKNQCTMPWVVFGDFNEITHQNEKLGWNERELKQMEGFRESLSKCGLFDLGFVGQRFTWCNEHLGEQRTLLRLDRIVANSSWPELYPEACVYHRSMSSSDHCLLYLTLKNVHPRKPVKKRFQFEAMWVREDGCKDVVEEAWDPYCGVSGYSIMERLKRCQVSLQGWNWSVFENVDRVLKQKQERLQQLEGLNCLHEKAKEIQGLRREINEMLTREEIMWNQRSRASWIK